MNTTTDNAQGLTDAALETAIEQSDGYWREDTFCIDGSNLMGLLRTIEALATHPPQQEEWLPGYEGGQDLRGDFVNILYVEAACQTEQQIVSLARTLVQAVERRAAPAAPARPESAEPELGKRPTPEADAEIRAMMVAFDAAVPVFRGPCSYSGMLAARLKLLSIHPTPAASDGGLREAFRVYVTTMVASNGTFYTVTADNGRRPPDATLFDSEGRIEIYTTEVRSQAEHVARQWDAFLHHREFDVFESMLRDPAPPTPQASTPAAVSNDLSGNSGALDLIAPAAVAPEQVTDAEVEAMCAAGVGFDGNLTAKQERNWWEYYGGIEGDRDSLREFIGAAGNALLALRAAQQKGGGQ